MATRTAEAKWEGKLEEGKGTMKLGSGVFEGGFSFGTRFEDAPGTNPEELIGAAHAGCFSMALSAELGKAGYTADSIKTTAEVSLQKSGDGFEIPKIDLNTVAKVAGIHDDEFQKIANATKEGCPVSKALSAIQINLKAELIN